MNKHNLIIAFSLLLAVTIACARAPQAQINGTIVTPAATSNATGISSVPANALDDTPPRAAVANAAPSALPQPSPARMVEPVKELTKQRANDFVSRIERLEAIGRQMQSLRGDSKSLSACGDMMRENAPKARTIEGELEAFRQDETANLGAAANSLYSCLTCSGNALFYCSQTREFIAAFKTRNN